MSTCYRCGSYIAPPGPYKRRKVRTGDVSRQTASGKRTSTQTYGVRLVCGRCAYLIDRDQTRKELRYLAELLIAIAILFIVLILGLLH